jgi:hypothetical protein
MTRQINEVPLKNYCISKWGEENGELHFPIELDKLKKQLENYDRMTAEKTALEIATAEREAKLPPLGPLEKLADKAHRAWLDAGAAVEDQRNSNVAALTPLRDQVASLITRIHLAFERPDQGAWGLPNAEDRARHHADTWQPTPQDTQEHLVANNPRLQFRPPELPVLAPRNFVTDWRK